MQKSQKISLWLSEISFLARRPRPNTSLTRTSHFQFDLAKFPEMRIVKNFYTFRVKITKIFDFAKFQESREKCESFKNV